MSWPALQSRLPVSCGVKLWSSHVVSGPLSTPSPSMPRMALLSTTIITRRLLLLLLVCPLSSRLMPVTAVRELLLPVLM